MIEVETLSDEECRRAIFSAAGKTKQAKTFHTICSVFFLVLGLFYLYLAFNPNIEGKSVTCGVVGVLFVLLAIFGRKLLFALSNRKFRNKTAEELTARYGFSEDCVTMTGSLAEGKYKWEAFDLHGTESHYLWLRRKADKAFVMVDKNKLSAEDAAQLEAWFEKVKG